MRAAPRLAHPVASLVADEVAALGVPVESLALSMGMSHDFEQALGLGATHVRVGSTSFGARPAKK